ncbi:helix-turn-helix transcriptional regulator [uncultured Anaerococcus sp.]|uniref:helix-turn-helix transcriptional regulator n=1 Tax=uncultured Anaerococcus sp. TaxID=293428 RepID=UPI0025D23250|nr:helix-turn-helix transcriptional regulator [uncultured Anaerococcus sp.]
MVNIEAINRKLGNKLKRLRIDAGLSRKQLADMFGLTVSAVGMYEQGRRTPSDDIKVKYSMMFDKSIDELFF